MVAAVDGADRPVCERSGAQVVEQVCGGGIRLALVGDDHLEVVVENIEQGVRRRLDQIDALLQRVEGFQHDAGADLPLELHVFLDVENRPVISEIAHAVVAVVHQAGEAGGFSR